jgi:hypothetical protein
MLITAMATVSPAGPLPQEGQRGTEVGDPEEVEAERSEYHAHGGRDHQLGRQPGVTPEDLGREAHHETGRPQECEQPSEVGHATAWGPSYVRRGRKTDDAGVRAGRHRGMSDSGCGYLYCCWLPRRPPRWPCWPSADWNCPVWGRGPAGYAAGPAGRPAGPADCAAGPAGHPAVALLADCPACSDGHVDRPAGLAGPAARLGHGGPVDRLDPAGPGGPASPADRLGHLADLVGPAAHLAGPGGP